MKRNKILTALAVLAFFGIATDPSVAGEPDQVQQSFERELNHEPAPPAKIRRESIDDDELYSIVNSVHWTRTDQEAAKAEEAAADETDEDDDTE